MIGKKLVPCIFIHQGKAVKWFDNFEVISEDVVSLAKNYDLNGADELFVFDLSQNDEEHDLAIDTLKKVTREVHIPITAGGNIKRQEDVKKILYAGAQKAMVNLSKVGSIELVEEVSKRFGKEKIVVSTYKMLWDHIEIVNKYASAIVAMSIEEVKEIVNDIILPVYALQSCCEESDISELLNNELISGIIGGSLNNTEFDFLACKEFCSSIGICMNALECNVAFKEFKLNSDGLIPVIVQDFRTNEVLMMAYMNEEAYVKTLLCGKMTYYSRSRNSLWLKGETSGHYQYVKSLTVDCDKDTILAKVDQIGVACHTGAPTCFFTPLVEDKFEELNPLKVFESVYDTIMDRKLHPKEGSYTNYLFDKGIDKILKKVGEEATELVIAAKNPNPEEIKYELSDFLYHAMVLMVERGVSWDDIVKELADR